MACPVFLEITKGVKMPIVGLGTRQEQGADDTEMVNAIDKALELGYRHFDSAFQYENEKPIGQVLKKWISSGRLKREDVFITTKLPMVGIFPDKVETYLRKSLENLQLDYVDLYLVHFPIAMKEITEDDKFTGERFGNYQLAPFTDHIGVWKLVCEPFAAKQISLTTIQDVSGMRGQNLGMSSWYENIKMEEQVDAGRARAIGVSNFNQKLIAKILEHARIKPANNQIELHVYLQQNDLVNFCHDNGISIVAYAPICTPAYKKVMKRWKIEGVELPKLLEDPVIVRIAQKHKKTPAQVALKFLVQKNISVVPKTVTPARMKENIELFDFDLDQEDLKDIENLDRGEGGRICAVEILRRVENYPDFPLTT